MSSDGELIHDAVRTDPESVWDRLAAWLCKSARGPASVEDRPVRIDLIEELMFWHAETFIDRFEELVEGCPGLRQDVLDAHVGGRPAGPGLQRFYGLQDEIGREFDSLAQ